MPNFSFTSYLSILIFAFVVSVTGSSYGQFMTSYNSYSVDTFSQELDIVLKNQVFNVGQDSINLAWKRTVNDFPVAKWTGTSVCDNVNCAAPQVSQRNFDAIAPGDSSRLDMHFLTNGYSGEATAELLVWDINDSANSVQVIPYSFKNDPSFATSISNILTEEDVELSVVNGYVQLSAMSDARLTVNIYDLLGNQVKSASCNGMLSLDVRDLPATMYFVQVLQGSALVKTQSFVR
ncbi:MAG: T9SS type A sorting domain-containing protein [Bacteroidota bacterium]|nr:T9SS type A sorting domain-containing protein [Bacteroidota bacterium]